MHLHPQPPWPRPARELLCSRKIEMSSVLQIEANRRNSQLSTGPRSAEGKAVSRFNALKSGINARAQVIPGEDPADLEAMAAGYHRDWAPATWLERFLVDSLVRADWLLQRLSRLEAELWAHEMQTANDSASKLDEKAPTGDVYGRACDRFTRLQRRIDSAERSYYRALTQLQHLRASREPGPELPPSEPQASDPVPDPAPLVGEIQLTCLEEPGPELASFCRAPLPAAGLTSSTRSNP